MAYERDGSPSGSDATVNPVEPVPFGDSASSPEPEAEPQVRLKGAGGRLSIDEATAEAHLSDASGTASTAAKILLSGAAASMVAARTQQVRRGILESEPDLPPPRRRGRPAIVLARAAMSSRFDSTIRDDSAEASPPPAAISAPPPPVVKQRSSSPPPSSPPVSLRRAPGREVKVPFVGLQSLFTTATQLPPDILSSTPVTRESRRKVKEPAPEAKSPSLWTSQKLGGSGFAQAVSATGPESVDDASSEEFASETLEREDRERSDMGSDELDDELDALDEIDEIASASASSRVASAHSTPEPTEALNRRKRTAIDFRLLASGGDDSEDTESQEQDTVGQEQDQELDLDLPTPRHMKKNTGKLRGTYKKRIKPDTVVVVNPPPAPTPGLSNLVSTLVVPADAGKGGRGYKRKAAELAIATLRKAIPLKKKHSKKKRKVLHREEEDPNFELLLHNASSAGVSILHYSPTGGLEKPKPVHPTSVRHSDTGTETLSSYYYSVPSMPAKTIDGVLFIIINAPGSQDHVGNVLLEEQVLLGLGHGKLRVEFAQGELTWSILGGRMRILGDDELRQGQV